MTDYYFDFDNGADANSSPYSPSNALKNLPGTSDATGNAIFNPTAGDNLFLAKGSVWNITDVWKWQTADSGADGNPVIVDAYDRQGETNQDKPIVGCFEILSTVDWTESATPGVWFAALRTDSANVNRVFFDLVGQKPGAVSIVTCTPTTPWWFDNVTDTIYVYSGSSISNPSDLQEVRCTSRNSTSSAGAITLDLDKVTYLRFNNIAFRGGDTWTVFIRNTLLGTDSGDIQFYNCDMHYPGEESLKFRITVNQNYIGKNIIDSCNFDKKWSVLENIGSEISGNGINIEGGFLNNLEIKNNTFIDFTHSGLNINKSSAAVPIVDGVISHHNTYTCPNPEYGRGISINGTHAAGYVDNTFIYAETIFNTSIRNQIEGKNTWFYGNFVGNTRADGIYGNRSEGVQVQARSGAEVDGVVIANNVFYATHNHCIKLVDTVTFPIVSVLAYNNICIQPAGNNEQECFIYIENDVKGTLDVTNNKFYSADTATTITWDGVGYTVTAADAALVEMADNLATSETLDASYLPPKTSDCIGNGRKWWTGANPETLGDPISDIDADIGFGTTFSPFHPKNL